MIRARFRCNLADTMSIFNLTTYTRTCSGSHFEIGWRGKRRRIFTSIRSQLAVCSVFGVYRRCPFASPPASLFPRRIAPDSPQHRVSKLIVVLLMRIFSIGWRAVEQRSFATCPGIDKIHLMLGATTAHAITRA